MSPKSWLKTYFSLREKKLTCRFWGKRVWFSTLRFVVKMFEIFQILNFFGNVQDFEILRFFPNFVRFFRFSDSDIFLKIFEIFRIFEIFWTFRIFRFSSNKHHEITVNLKHYQARRRHLGFALNTEKIMVQCCYWGL